MINDLYLSLSVVIPMFLMMLIGVYVRQKKIVTNESLTIMNALVFRIFLSALIFMNIVKMEKEKIVSLDNLKLIGILGTIIVMVTIITIFIFEKLKIDKQKIPVMVQGTFRSNITIFGIPMALSLYGENGLGALIIISIVIVPFNNGISVALLESYATGKVKMNKLLISIFKNPIIFWSIVAIIFVFLEIPIPKILESSLISLGNVATPLSFVVLGATLDLKKISKNFKYNMIVNVIKLIILPFVGIILGIKFGLRNEYLLGILSATGAPNAIASFIMVKEIGGDADLAAELIIFSTLFSIVTIFLWIFALKTLGYL